jgi:hypothetical protein
VYRVGFWIALDARKLRLMENLCIVKEYTCPTCSEQANLGLC